MGSSTLHVEAALKNISFVEDFIYASKYIPDDKRMAALIIATEIFDNIAEHAVLVKNSSICLTVSNIFFPHVCFKYCSKNFSSLLEALENTQPHYDVQSKRYRGFGLRMTKNLARKVRYRERFGCVRIVVYL